MLAAGSAALAAWRATDATTGAVPLPDEAVTIGHPVYSFNPKDDQALAAFATDIFLGRVIAQTGTVGAPTSAPGQELPMTQFSVAVLRVVKGRTSGTVTANQVGGLDHNVLVTRADGRRTKETRLFLLDGDALLVPGEVALFVSVHVPQSGWYQVVAGSESHPGAVNRAAQDALVERFARAARGQSG
jgi:hypothetical protein